MLSNTSLRRLQIALANSVLAKEISSRLIDSTPANPSDAQDVLDTLDTRISTISKLKSTIQIGTADRAAGLEIATKLNGMIEVLKAQANGDEVAAVGAAYSGNFNCRFTFAIQGEFTGNTDTTLSFDGVKTVQQAVDAYNVDAEIHLVISNGDGAIIPNAGQTMAVTGGHDRTYARYDGSLVVTSAPIVIQADDTGTSGNVTLSFDGVKTVQQAVNAYNVAFPADSIVVISGDTSVIPINGQTLPLTGGDLTTQAEFNGSLSVTLGFSITADNPGTVGNVTLTYDGSKDVNTVVSDWNTAHPSATVTLAAGIGSLVPLNSQQSQLTGGTNNASSMFSGYVLANSGSVSITANTAGAAGNITLSFNGTLTLALAISNWNGSNPSNQITKVTGTGSIIPDNVVEIMLTGGSDAADFDIAASKTLMGSDHMSERTFKSIKSLFKNQGSAEEFRSAYNDMIDAVQAIEPLS